ncbi:MAG: NADH-quinone oxidoreductase subunit J [Anaerolineales bacterium]|nr:NADH-quinone oxidoreductase subunit J [Anaerolineales bacterium]
MIYMLLIAFTVLFAVLAIRAKRLLSSALWLAVVSGLLAVIFYFMGAQLVAVIELSIGAGLVTVLFVFAISIAGEDDIEVLSVVPRPLAAGATILLFLLLGWFLLPTQTAQPPHSEPSISTVMWEQRSLDVLLQIAIIFAGVLGLLGLLAEGKAPLGYHAAEQAAASRDRELDALYQQSIPKEAP